METSAQRNSQSADYGLRREVLRRWRRWRNRFPPSRPQRRRGYDSTCLRSGRQRHVARLCAGDGGHSSGAWCISRSRAIRLRPARLYLRLDDPSPWLAATAAWSLLLAYIATGSSVIGGFYHYSNLLLHDATAASLPPFSWRCWSPRYRSESRGATLKSRRG